MSLTVTVPATATKLCLVEEVMEELGCAVEDEPTLTDIVQQVSDAIGTYCGRIFAKQTYEETVAGYGDVHMILSVWPIVSVTSVLSNGAAITDFTLQEPENGMLYRAAGWDWTTRWVGRISPKPFPESETQSFVVTYVAGYDLPAAMLPNLPGDIERAAIIVAKDWFVNLDRNVSIKVMKTPDMTVEWLEHNLPPSAMRLLTNHRSER